jgi:hypothetical protein
MQIGSDKNKFKYFNIRINCNQISEGLLCFVSMYKACYFYS